MPVFELGYRTIERPRGGWRFPTFWIAWRSFTTRVRWPFFAVLVPATIPLFVKFFQVYTSGLLDDASELPHEFAREIARGTINPFGYGDGLYFDLISTEIFFVVVMLMVTGAGQIAEDFRSGALQLYFSRPVDQAQYVLGKLGSAVLSGLLVTLAPCLLLLVACCAFAPNWNFLTGNPWLPLRFAAFSLLVSVVLGIAVLALSAMGRTGRSVAIMFGGGYFFSMVLGRVLPQILQDPRWEVVHVGNALDAVGRSFFRTGPVVDSPRTVAWILLGAIVAASVLVLARRVDPVEAVR